MKKYKVVVSADAEADLFRYRDYLLKEKRSKQAAKNVVLDYRETRKVLENVAGSLREPESDELRKRGLKRINFLKHDYFLLYKIEGNTAYVTNMFHTLEDYEKKLK